MWPPVVIRRFGIIHENKLLFAKMCEEMRVTMKKGKQKNNATTRAGRKEELTAYLCLIPAFLGVTLISYLPTLAVFVLSLFDWNGITKPEFIEDDQWQPRLDLQFILQKEIREITIIVS